MKNDSYFSYSRAVREQNELDAQIKHDLFKRKINEKPRRKKKKK